MHQIPSRHRVLFFFAGVALLSACSAAENDTDASTGKVATSAAPADLSAEYANLSRSEGVGDEDWFDLARRAREAGDTATASRALDYVTADSSTQRVALERARIEIAAGDRDAAVGILTALSEGGFSAVRLITDDDVLDSLAGHGEYDELVRAMSEQAFPCRYDEAFRAFDFWVGEWDVHVAGGQFAGHNSIRSEESGCVITEHWTGASGSTGSSINYLDRRTGEWVQVWNSEGGAQISIRGGMTGEGMRLTGQIHYVGNGTTADFRGLWTPMGDGRVRQFFEQSNDDGETWSPWFEGFYTRRSAETNE